MHESEVIKANIEQLNAIGKRGMQSLDESSKAVVLSLQVLNGGGLVATLAFMGTILASTCRATSLPFYWSAICFGFGLLCTLAITLGNFFYFRCAVTKHIQKTLQADTVELTTQLSDQQKFNEFLGELSILTKAQIFFTQHINKFLWFSAGAFVSGMFSGFIYLFYL